MKKKVLSGLFCLLVFFSTLSLSISTGSSQEEQESPVIQKPGPLYSPEIATGSLRLFQLGQLSHLISYHFLPPVLLSEGLRLSLDIPKVPGLHLFHDTQRRNKKRFGRALWEGVAHFVYSTSSYYIREDVMKEDWEYQFTWEDQKRRFFLQDGMRFDSNSFGFNWTHSLAGALYYNYARTNHLNPLESFLYSFTSSYIWEFIVEFREVVSINDSIATPIGGVSIGESVFQLGRFFRSQQPTALNRLARFLSNPVMALNDWIDPRSSLNQYAFLEDYWHDCSFFMGPRFDTFESDEANSFIQLGIETQLIHIPEFGQPGSARRYMGKTIFTQFDIDGTFNNKGLYAINIYAKSVLFGFFIQDIHTSASGNNSNHEPSSRLDFEELENETPEGFSPVEHLDDNRAGYSLFLGVSSAFDMASRNHRLAEGSVTNNNPGNQTLERQDKYTIINLLGPTVDLALFQKSINIRLTVDAYADFALVHSHAFKEYSRQHPYIQTKSTLEKHGYYYALGFTVSSSLQFNFSHIELKGKMKYHYFDSIEGLDRFQSEIKPEEDFDLQDSRFMFNFSLGYTIPDTALQVILGVEQTDRKGVVERFSQDSMERRSYIQVRYRF